MHAHARMSARCLHAFAQIETRIMLVLIASRLLPQQLTKNAIIRHNQSLRPSSAPPTKAASSGSAQPPRPATAMARNARPGTASSSRSRPSTAGSRLKVQHAVDAEVRSLDAVSSMK